MDVHGPGRLFCLRIKRFDLVETPAFELVTAADRFATPTRRVNQLWQTDFTYFKIQDWGWYYLSTVLDDYSRYILSWKLTPTMAATDVQETLEKALAETKLDRVRVRHRPPGCCRTMGRTTYLGICDVSWRPAGLSTLAERHTTR